MTEAVQQVQDVIRNAVLSGDLASLEAWLAEDVELNVAVTAGPAGLRDRRKAPVLERLRQLGDPNRPPDTEAASFLGNGQRIVAFWDEAVPLSTGIGLRCECTLVFDLRDGCIARLTLHHELVPVSGERGAASLAPPARDTGPASRRNTRERMGRRAA